MADMDTKERTGAINPEKDFHLDIAPGKSGFVAIADAIKGVFSTVNR